MSEDLDKKLQKGLLKLSITSSVLSGLPLLFIGLFSNHTLFIIIWMIFIIVSVRIAPWVLNKIEKIFK